MFKRLKPWQVGGLVALVAVFVIGVYGASSLFGGSEVPEPEPPVVSGISGQEAVVEDVPVIGRLAFPRHEELTFATGGEIGEILAQVGDRVEPGQVLARLDAVTIAALSRVLAQARQELDLAEDRLDEAREDFVATPLEKAQFEQKIAQAQVALDDAADALDDFQRDHGQTLAKFRIARAEAEVAVDDAEKALRDFERDHQQTLAAALIANADAEIALDVAQDQLSDFERDESQGLAQARRVQATAEVTLDNAQDDLLDFVIDYDEELAIAKLRVANAEVALDTAEDALTAYKINPTANIRDGENIDVEALARREVAVAAAQAELSQSQKELARIDGGPNSLQQQELAAAVELARTNLTKAQAEVSRLSQGLDQFELSRREAAVQAAAASLAQTTEDLAEELAGPDLLRQSALEAELELTQAELAQANIDLEKELAGPDAAAQLVREQEVAKKREELAKLTDGPDPLVVALAEAEVASAQARVDDARQDLEGATIRATFDGVVWLVNGKVDDLVTKDSRVLELVDPSQLEMVGRVDASDRDLVAVGDAAQVSVAALSEQSLTGTVVWVSDQPGTERGVVSYALRIAVQLPPQVEAPVTLSAVSAVVTRRQ